MRTEKDEESSKVGELMRREREREIRPHEACGRPLRVAKSRHEVAALMGTTARMVQQVECGHSLPSQEFMTKYAGAVEADEDVWCGWMRARGGTVSDAFVAGFDAGRRSLHHLVDRELADEVLAVNEASRAGGADGETERETLSRLIRLGLEADRRGGF